jgi:hypothetical protein
VRKLVFSLTLSFCAAIAASGFSLDFEKAPPADFPHFSVPGHEQEMELLRELDYLHYPGSSPKATLWDIWLVSPSLWPAYTEPGSTPMRDQWNQALSSRHIDSEGYVASHQHASIAHQGGWPFPFWNQGRHGFGWHFSFDHTIGKNWRPDWIAPTSDWQTTGIARGEIGKLGWNLELTSAVASIAPPPQQAHALEAPFVQLRWAAENLHSAQPYVEWTTPESPAFTPERRMYFDALESTPTVQYTMIPVYRHPLWKGVINSIRLNFGNPQPGARIVIQALFSNYDTRHNINNQAWICGCSDYFNWTHDLTFLRANINQMRLAMRYTMTENNTIEEGVVHTTWIGHDGRSGLKRNAEGKAEQLTGLGIGNNYWDLLPFGGRDAYATIYYYSAIERMARIEGEIAAHPEWNMPGGPLKLESSMLSKHAANVKKRGNEIFWNDTTGRFVAAVDADGNKPDYGFTFLNLDAVYYGFATNEHAQSIMKWIDGERVVADDTAQTTDIYHWRFAPRATTRRNLDYYFWAWGAPEAIPWGGQVQDGGAVLAFSFQDLMSRLRVLGPDNAANRLQEIVNWFAEVRKAGGYRKYYSGQREGTLQGGGTAGGLGLDQEFFESVLVPEVMIEGFLGFHPTGDGLVLSPQLPKSWPQLQVGPLQWRDQALTVTVSQSRMKIERSGPPVSTGVKITVPSQFIPPAGVNITKTSRKDHTVCVVKDFGSRSSIEFTRQ